MYADYAQRYRFLWERHWWWRSREALLLSWIAKLMEGRKCENCRILDIGCGDGLFFDRLSSFGEVEGLETDPSFASDPRWQGRIRLGSLGEEAEILPDASYDLVLMLDVVEHIADDIAALRAARSALKPGGHLLITVPALGWLWSRHDEWNEHYRRYNPRELERVLAAAGFEFGTMRYFFVWTVGPMLVRRWLLSRTKSGAGGEAVDLALGIPPAPINRLLTLVSRAEHALGRYIPWPIGSSLLAVAQVAVNPTRMKCGVVS